MYNQIQEVIIKILKEVKHLHAVRKREIVKNSHVKWTNVEVAQLLVAVLNLGEGEWIEIQKRINFKTSGYIKTPN